ncbi:unnamed protein product [Cochlearia groenlandica]
MLCHRVTYLANIRTIINVQAKKSNQKATNQENGGELMNAEPNFRSDMANKVYSPEERKGDIIDAFASTSKIENLKDHNQQTRTISKARECM